jgi:hypothetical protein
MTGKTKPMLESRDLTSLVVAVASKVCDIIENGERPSDAEPAFLYGSCHFNDRLEHIGHVYGLMRRDDLPARVLKAEALLGEVIYCFRQTLTKYDKKIVDEIDAWLKDGTP